MKTLKILNSSFEQVAQINNYEFFQWVRNLRAVDTFELHINKYKEGVEYLISGNWIIVNIGGNNRAGRIEQRKLSLTEEGKASENYVIKGYSGAQPLLNRYIIEDQHHRLTHKQALI